MAAAHGVMAIAGKTTLLMRKQRSSERSLSAFSPVRVSGSWRSTSMLAALRRRLAGSGPRRRSGSASGRRSLRGYREHAPRDFDGRVVGREYFKGDWEPIFTENEHLALLEVLNDSRRISERRASFSLLLTGVLRCGTCGERMKYLNAIGKGKKKFPRYGCVKQPGTRNCGHIACSMNSVDRLVTTKLLAVIAAGRPIDHSGEVAQLETLLDEGQGSADGALSRPLPAPQDRRRNL